MENEIQYSKFEDLKNNSTIKFSPNGDTYKVTKIFEENTVDLLATKPHNVGNGLDIYHEFYSIKLDKFIIVD